MVLQGRINFGFKSLGNKDYPPSPQKTAVFRLRMNAWLLPPMLPPNKSADPPLAEKLRRDKSEGFRSANPSILTS